MNSEKRVGVKIVGEYGIFGDEMADSSGEVYRNTMAKCISSSCLLYAISRFDYSKK